MVCSRESFRNAPNISGQYFEKPTPIKPEYHLVPCINNSFKFVVPQPKNCGLVGLQYTDVHPFECKLVIDVK